MKYRATGILFAVLAIVLLSFSDNGIPAFSGKNATADSSGLNTPENPIVAADNEKADFFSAYTQMDLENSGLSAIAFEQAIKGWKKLKESNQLSNEDLLTIVDFSQPSTRKRLYVIDIRRKSLLFNTYVAHGRNSGKEQAINFSNNPSSYKSSPGFYRTENTYYGNNGYSLRLEGLEKGINDNAESRAIVMHGADYVNEGMIRSMGYIGRSQGCPAIPTKLTRPIINTIKNGSCLFIYAPTTYYAERSDLVR
jgi:hypothetical protein